MNGLREAVFRGVSMEWAWEGWPLHFLAVQAEQAVWLGGCMSLRSSQGRTTHLAELTLSPKPSMIF